MKNKKHRELLYTLLSVLALLLLWKVVSMLVDREILIPSPEATFREIIRIGSGSRFISSVGSTVRRALIGFAIALGAGFILGILAGFSNMVYQLLKPFVLIVRALPTMAMILLALIWLESEYAPILVGLVVIFPIIYENVVQGIRNVDPKLVEMMTIYKVGRFDKLRHLYIPSIRSYLYSGMAAAMGLNLKIIIAAEVLSQPKTAMGTGFQIERANLNTAGVFAWSLITIVLAGVLEHSLKLLQKKK